MSKGTFDAPGVDPGPDANTVRVPVITRLFAGGIAVLFVGTGADIGH